MFLQYLLFPGTPKLQITTDKITAAGALLVDHSYEYRLDSNIIVVITGN